MPKSTFDILQSGTDTVSNQFQDTTNFVLIGTSVSTAPTLRFIGGTDQSHPYLVNSLLVENGQIDLGFRTDLTVTSGIAVLGGQLLINDFYSSTTLNGSGLISANGTLVDNGGGAQGGGVVNINGTLTVGSIGANKLELPGVGGDGTILQTGNADVTSISGNVGSGVHLNIQAGNVTVGSSFGAFLGTIGPTNGKGPSLGPSASLTYETAAFNPTNVQSATFDTSTGILSFLNASGQTLYNPLHFSGNARGLNISTSSGMAVTITDHPGAGSVIPITFTS